MNLNTRSRTLVQTTGGDLGQSKGNKGVELIEQFYISTILFFAYFSAYFNHSGFVKTSSMIREGFLQSLGFFCEVINVGGLSLKRVPLIGVSH